MEMLFLNKGKQNLFVDNLGQSPGSTRTLVRMDSNTGFIAFVTVFHSLFSPVLIKIHV